MVRKKQKTWKTEGNPALQFSQFNSQVPQKMDRDIFGHSNFVSQEMDPFRNGTDMNNYFTLEQQTNTIKDEKMKINNEEDDNSGEEDDIDEEGDYSEEDDDDEEEGEEELNEIVKHSSTIFGGSQFSIPKNSPFQALTGKSDQNTSFGFEFQPYPGISNKTSNDGNYWGNGSTSNEVQNLNLSNSSNPWGLSFNNEPNGGGFPEKLDFSHNYFDITKSKNIIEDSSSKENNAQIKVNVNGTIIPIDGVSRFHNMLMIKGLIVDALNGECTTDCLELYYGSKMLTNSLTLGDYSIPMDEMLRCEMINHSSKSEVTSFLNETALSESNPHDYNEEKVLRITTPIGNRLEFKPGQFFSVAELIQHLHSLEEIGHNCNLTLTDSSGSIIDDSTKLPTEGDIYLTVETLIAPINTADQESLLPEVEEFTEPKDVFLDTDVSQIVTQPHIDHQSSAPLQISQKFAATLEEKVEDLKEILREPAIPITEQLSSEQIKELLEQVEQKGANSFIFKAYEVFTVDFDSEDFIENMKLIASSKCKQPLCTTKQNKSTSKFCLRWKLVQGQSLLVLNHDECIASGKIAAFDLDGTIITTKSGNRFAKGGHDWKLMFALQEMSGKFEELSSKGYKIVIFSNQLGIGMGRMDMNQNLKKRVKRAFRHLGVKSEYLQGFFALRKDKLRKPFDGMLKYMIGYCNQDVSLDFTESFYVGDAAGRKNDHSDVDLQFAISSGLRFFTPEEFFLGETKPSVSPSTISKRDTEDYSGIARNEQEMLLLVGPPGSGKSTFAKNYLSEYTYINRDTLQTQEKCLRNAQEALRNKSSVVIDNTNPSVTARSPYIKLAQLFKLPVRCLVMRTPISLCMALNKFRERKTGTKAVPAVAYNAYKKNYQEPTTDEGIQEIKDIYFQKHSFESPEEEQLFKQLTAYTG